MTEAEEGVSDGLRMRAFVTFLQMPHWGSALTGSVGARSDIGDSDLVEPVNPGGGVNHAH